MNHLQPMLRTVKGMLAGILVFSLMLTACEDDPIIGPTDDDSGGGSYGVIHFQQAPQDSTTTVTPAARPLQPTNNPKRF